jgi:hypothetical protein
MHLLESVKIVFFDPASFGVSQITPFIGRTQPFEAFDRALMQFLNDSILVTLSSRGGTSGGHTLMLSVILEDLSWGVERLIKSDRQFSLLPNSKHFDINIIEDRFSPPHIGNSQWLTLLRKFSAVQDLHLSQFIALCVIPALAELHMERVTEVLPALRNLFIERLDSIGSVQEAIGTFVSTRQLAGKPLAVECWQR